MFIHDLLGVYAFHKKVPYVLVTFERDDIMGSQTDKKNLLSHE